MIRLGYRQELLVKKRVDFGFYLTDSKESSEEVLLPTSSIIGDIDVGDAVNCFIYKDSSDRIVATMKKSLICMDELAVLKVKDMTKIGAFLDWGLEKDLLLPFSEKTYPLDIGSDVLVRLYIDNSERLCASMKVYRYLSNESGYKLGDKVKGFVYDVNEQHGVFVAVDNLYSARIPKKDCVIPMRYGERITARVAGIMPDGRLTLNLKEAIHIQIDIDAKIIYDELLKDGSLPYNDKTDSTTIKRHFNMSKNAFKRAVGRLLKENKIEQYEGGIKLANK